MPPRRHEGLRVASTSARHLGEDWNFDRHHQRDMRSEALLETLKIRSASKALGGGYGQTRERHFRKLLSVITLPKPPVFLDMGYAAKAG